MGNALTYWGVDLKSDLLKSPQPFELGTSAGQKYKKSKKSKNSKKSLNNCFLDPTTLVNESNGWKSLVGRGEQSQTVGNNIKFN